ncbi:MAG TPA: AraC family transcriptional regulator [Pyrinomonadaceae bacterium]|nr:AraC family transcriptional regulator [Pyrinomonadaceae bacterium]
MSSTASAMISREAREASVETQFERGDKRVARALEFMRQNYHRSDLRLEDFAREVNLSIWHLSHLFKSQTNDSPAHYLKSIRLKRACDLLALTTLSVKEVMHKVGLCDQSHFAKDFKRAYGSTPTQFRDSIREAAYRHQMRTETRNAAPA